MTEWQDRVAALPRWKVVCGRYPMKGPHNYHFSVLWGKLENPQEGGLVYVHEFGIEWACHLRIIRW